MRKPSKPILGLACILVTLLSTLSVRSQTPFSPSLSYLLIQSSYLDAQSVIQSGIHTGLTGFDNAPQGITFTAGAIPTIKNTIKAFGQFSLQHQQAGPYQNFSTDAQLAVSLPISSKYHSFYAGLSGKYVNRSINLSDVKLADLSELQYFDGSESQFLLGASAGTLLKFGSHHKNIFSSGIQMYYLPSNDNQKSQLQFQVQANAILPLNNSRWQLMAQYDNLNIKNFGFQADYFSAFLFSFGVFGLSNGYAGISTGIDTYINEDKNIRIITQYRLGYPWAGVAWRGGYSHELTCQLSHNF